MSAANDFSGFADALISWWKDHGRSFPWRFERNPYRVLVAETLLHRTRAENVVPVYQHFITVIPDNRSLAVARENVILDMTRSLGLRWRVKLLPEAARIIEKEFGGTIPMDRKQLLSLPGVGDYITSAIRVFTGEFSDALMDTNTVRVISRIYGVGIKESARRSEKMRIRYSKLRNGRDAREFGYAMIDLAATICLSGQPQCYDCPVRPLCMAVRSLQKDKAPALEAGRLKNTEKS